MQHEQSIEEMDSQEMFSKDSVRQIHEKRDTKTAITSHFFSPMLDFFLSPFQFNLEELEAGLSEINANNDKLQHFYNKLVEYKLLFDKCEWHL
ncbi:hypothetical protein HID58_014558 [Brassica napus]|uniref:Uncharacterized protein n=1 Tax=Brassica napus TaxID=3708 RepID=A0ABQ8DHG8_BRANA|nr:hypothetical protein HID58_014558 [Brassica napus]